MWNSRFPLEQLQEWVSLGQRVEEREIIGHTDVPEVLPLSLDHTIKVIAMIEEADRLAK